MSIKTVFFDAGNTLVFGDSERILAPLAARGVSPTQEQLYAAERVAKRRLDEARAHHTSVDAQFWDIYYSHLLAENRICARRRRRPRRDRPRRPPTQLR